MRKTSWRALYWSCVVLGAALLGCPMHAREGHEAPPPPAPPTTSRPVSKGEWPATRAYPKEAAPREAEPPRKAAPRPSETGRPKEGPSGSAPDFPWPPPRASARYVIPAELLPRPSADTSQLKALDQCLSHAIESCGYSERGYFKVPGGFALVTRIEQVDADGNPVADRRWVLELSPVRRFSLEDYLRALLTAPRGYYRMFAFIVTSESFTEGDRPMDRDTASTLIHHGTPALPEAIGRDPYTPAHVCTVLVYEFEQRGAGAPAQLEDPSHLDGKTHLTRARILTELTP